MKKFKAVTCLSLTSILFITFGSQKIRIRRQQQVAVSSSSTTSLLLMTATNTSSNTTTTVYLDDSRQDYEQDHKKDEPSLLEDKEEEDSSSYYFSWVGNQWIPPKGVPTYTPKQMLEYFVNKNTLIIGDSTGRRFYTTLFAMMTSPDISNIASALVNSAKVIDVNRGRRFGEERCRKEGRSLADNTTTFIETLCRNVFKKDQEESIPSILSNSTTRNNDAEVSEMAARNQSDAPADLLMKASSHDDNTPSSTSSSSSSTMRDQKKGKFDYVRMNCYSEVNDYFAENGFHHHLPNSTTLKKDYDLIVIALGIWEVIRPLPCRQINNQTVHDPVQRLRQTLNTLWQQSSSFDTQFVFRTVGFDHNRGHGLSYRMINATREFIKNVTTIRRQHENCARGREQVESLLVPCHHQEGNMIVVDWGSAISKRSFGQDRINGDIKAHYGLEARLLFAQQLMHQLTIASRSSSSSRRSYEKS